MVCKVISFFVLGSSFFVCGTLYLLSSHFYIGARTGTSGSFDLVCCKAGVSVHSVTEMDTTFWRENVYSQDETIAGEDSDSPELTSHTELSDGFDNSCNLTNDYLVKDVVFPGIYNLNSKMSLRVFMKDFERYFSNKFFGNDRDRCRIFSQLIEGDIFGVFEAVGGTHLGYSEVKRSLLYWYDSQHYSRHHSRKLEFYNATMKTGESYTLYALRLEVLAKKLYPRNDHKAVKILKKQFDATVPEWVRSKVEEKGDLIKFVFSRSLTWSNL